VEKYNLIAAWVSVLFGLLSGIPMGLFFHNKDWLGGYGSWKRRLLRLSHISFFGLAFLNFAFVGTVWYLKLDSSRLVWPSVLFIVAMITMPLVCAISAFKPAARNAFFVPVLSVVGATSVFIVQMVLK
jgi:hypothetical protein